MKTERFRYALEGIKLHTGIFLKGLLRTIYGTAVSVAIVLAVYGFCTITNETGYDAVGDFVVSCALLSVALWNMYVMGMKRGAKH